MSAVDLCLLTAGLLLGLGPLALLGQGRGRSSAVVYSASGLLCAVLALSGLAGLGGLGIGTSRVLPLGLPWMGAHFAFDALTAFFLVVLGFGGGIISLYAIGYGRHEHAPMRVLPFYPAFLGAMALVLLAADAFSFLLSWEVMSLLSWALVLTHHQEEDARKAGYVYLVMAGFGTMSLLLAFGLLAGPDGAYQFDAMRGTAHPPLMAVAILGLMLLGAGSKAGLAPLHVWLPLAHPAAPSHVSALMSGVMTKVALYGFIRVVFDLLGPVAWWASPVVILLGAGTAVLGILLAMMERDLKRALAYSTIENIGVIFAALGLAMAFRANGMTAAAALAFTAALFHIFNHMAFKSLLFMGAGSVLNATGLRDLDGLGGLIHRMPVTSFLVLVGAMAISALPPLNGFASEWLIFQAVLLSPDAPQAAVQMIIPAAGGLLALAAALAAACFVRIYGVGFLGRPHSEAAANAQEVDRVSLTAMALLAATCLLAGIFPGTVIDAMAPVVDAMLSGRLPVQADETWFTIIPIAESRSSYSGMLVFVFVALSASAAAWAVHRFASDRLRRAPAWDCGFPDASPLTQYSAGGFAQPIRRVYGTDLLGARETVTMPPPGDTGPARHELLVGDPSWNGIYLRLALAVTYVTTRMNRLQFLTIRRYLTLVFMSLIVLLVGLMLWR
ncbi:hydrogenase 4 subunit B [Frigidibacter sp. ROC022]|uniref:hydrogenase 4 subunit B n=1 Tax=Frigidibacter sp. ROC022 TaxID=2971796 RepID=UPI00215B6912|nr:hydrogenase 4 subunit B [Frigidibacter sp. ROC022]MCR8725515.1 hydrogenase 4 subunit B [Frigidibacter sp. ROC022]